MSIKLKKRQEIDLSIEKIAFGGQGVAQYNNFVVFVDNSLPGDLVTARVRKVRKKYAEAYPVDLIESSPLRLEAPCAHFGYCGGCKWQNVDYSQQLVFKKQHVEESLQHIGKIETGIVRDTLPAPEIFGYRNKMEFSFSDNRWLTPEELDNPDIKKGFAIGLHVPRFFDRVIDIQKCWIQPDDFNEILAFTREFFKKSGIPVYNLRRKDGVLRHLALRKSVAFDQVMISVVTFSPIEAVLQDYSAQITQINPKIVSVINTINDTYAQVASGSKRQVIWGKSTLREKLASYEFEISADSFFQTNTRQAENLYEIVKHYAEIDDNNVWDLYCGTGSIAIYIANKARRVIGFEIVENAIKDAWYNAEINDIHNCEFVAGDLRYNLEKYAHQPPDVLICDPPRAGMHKDVIRTILAIAPRRIVYVSCNPATMARDLSALLEKYRVLEVQPVDMFPHTYHIESVAKLEKI